MLLGVQDLRTASDGNYQRIKVESAEVHENYRYIDGRRGYYDIAVLILKSDIEYNSLSVQPICLPYQANNQQDYWDDKTGVITGYAHQDDAVAYLSNTQMTVLSTAKCNQILDDEVETIKDCKFSSFFIYKTYFFITCGFPTYLDIDSCEIYRY